MALRHRTRDLTLVAGPNVYDDFLPMKQILERRGARFIKVESNTWRIYIPMHLAFQPFFKFLEEQDCIAKIGPVKIRNG